MTKPIKFLSHTLFLSIAVCECVSGFQGAIPPFLPLRRQTAMSQSSSRILISAEGSTRATNNPTLTHQLQILQSKEAKSNLQTLLRRSNTLQSAGIDMDNPKLVVAAVVAPATTQSVAKLGFWGHFALSMTSIVLVKIIYRLFVLKPAPADDDPPPPAGILNRCPWPFIFFHDIKQGFKDSPTWMVVTWIVLWKISRKFLLQQ
jgi:hypothetical protein